MSVPTDTDGAWIFAYFRQLYDGKLDVGPQGLYTIPLTDEKLSKETLHLAWSRDGRHWTPLNDNRPTVPFNGRTWWLRDPFVGRGPDGAFHLTATGGDSPRDLFYARSPDLIHWEEPISLPVMASVPQARNVWAPEWVWDAGRAHYLLVWSSSFGEHGWDDSRLWCAHTTDWKTLSAPQVLFDPGYTVIDGTFIQKDATWFLIVKDERFGIPHGEHRFLQVATAPDLMGPYTVQTGPIHDGTAEGPAVLDTGKADGPSRWLLLYDRCHANAYAAAESEDLLHWRTVEDVSFPHGARHGSVVRVTEDELAALRQAFGDE